MKTFEYRGFDAAGRARRGLIEAVDLKQAREKAVAAGVFTEQVSAIDSDRPGGRSGFSRTARAFFYAELAALLRAGLPLAGALDLMTRTPGPSGRSVAVAAIRDRIREGSPLARAMGSLDAGVHQAEIAFIAAGEKTGELEWTLKSISEFMEADAKVRQRLATALVYPAIIVCLAVAVAVGLLGFTVPRLTQVLSADMNVSLPLVTRATMAAGRAMVRFGPCALALAAAAAVAAARILSRRPDYRVALDKWIYGLPLVGHGYAVLSAMRFARTMALMARGGVPLVESVDLAGQATGSAYIRLQAGREAEAIRNGASLSEAVGRIPPLAPILAGIIQIGENSGALAQVLAGAADRCQNEWDQRLSRVMAWFEPLLILLVGLFVLAVVLSILLPILNLNRQLA